jgi:uncharacterized protein (DUF2344 family)
LDRAVLILRKRIRNIGRRRLPDDLTTDALLKGKCDVPQTLLNFYSIIISTKYPAKMSKNVERLAKTLSEDLIYAVTNGNIKTSKHINLGLAMKSNSRKIINIINKYGHYCSYTTTTNNLCTGLAYNNLIALWTLQLEKIHCMTQSE